MTSFSTKTNIIRTIVLIILTLTFLTNLFGQDDLTQKLMVGYQGWFLAEGDGAAPNKWVHWFNSSHDPSADKIGVDFWPAMDEYKDTYNTNMTYMDGSTAKLFSPYDSSTVNVHFRWMREYGIYGAYLQRFLGPVASRGDLFESRNQVLKNVINSANIYDGHFAVMYDISGVADDGQLYNKLISDWEYLVDTYDVLKQKGYVHQEGKPVIAIWGIGFKDRGLKTSTFTQILDYFQNSADEKYQAYVMGGVPSGWRTLSRDSETGSDWANIYNSLDMISPWSVGRYSNQSGIDSHKNNYTIPDLNTCTSNGVDYMPVIWPGFSWRNIKKKDDPGEPYNKIPRDGGNYFWRQAYNAVDAGVEFIYVAMFDETDEGTAIFKLAETKTQIPVEIQDMIVPLDADGYDLPSDWYLRLAGETQKMLDGTIGVTSSIPITPYEGNFKETISTCESKMGWTSGNLLSVNTSFEKRGMACLQSDGDKADEFKRAFDMPFSSGSSSSIGFWYYISDVSNLAPENQVELGSGGGHDVNEYNWSLDNSSFKNGWNYVKLDFVDAGVTGGDPNMEELNWFRIYHLKNDDVTTRIDDIKFRGADGVQIPVANPGDDIIKIDNDGDGFEEITLDATESIDFDGTITNYKWELSGSEISSSITSVQNLEVGTYTYTLTVTDNHGYTDQEQITISITEEFDDCDSKIDWKSSNTLTVNTTDQKKGTGCLQSKGSITNEFYKKFPVAISSDSCAAVGFWYYVDDVTKLTSSNEVELGSGGEPNKNEYSWPLSNLNNGWNYVILTFSEATVTGGEPDHSAFNWFRLYNYKSGSATTRIDDIKFLGNGGNLAPIADAGSSQTLKSDESGFANITLDGSESYDSDGTIVNYSWKENGIEIATIVKPTVSLSEGVHVITLTVTDNVGATNDDQVIITVDGDYFDDCDSKDDWEGSNPITVNTSNKKQGQGCLEAIGKGTDDFKKYFSRTYSIKNSSTLEFWYYVSDVSKLDANGQVEISSSGGPDDKEYNWQLNNLQNGWNYIVLEFSKAGQSGGAPDPDGINFFRLYRFKNGDVTSRIDGLKFGGVSENDLPVADAGQDQTLSDDDGNGIESITLDGSLSSDTDGLIVNYSWTENGTEIATGVNPTINLASGTHTITLTVTDDAGATDDDQVTIIIELYTSIDDEYNIPNEYSLNQNYPNPFNPSTTIKYGLKEEALVEVSIYNINGELVETLVHRHQAAGFHKVEWNAVGIPTGIYLYKINIEGKFTDIKKCILMK